MILEICLDYSYCQTQARAMQRLHPTLTDSVNFSRSRF